MIKNEVLNYIPTATLREVCDLWHKVNDIVNGSEDCYKQFDVTNDDGWYVDRDIDTDSCRIRITTDIEVNRTYLWESISLFYEGDWIADTDIHELE
jgi:hypothetical protein